MIIKSNKEEVSSALLKAYYSGEMFTISGAGITARYAPESIGREVNIDHPIMSMELAQISFAELSAPWNGEGLPPVGTVCEVLNSNLVNPEWERCTILYSGNHRVVYDSESCEERTAFIDDLSFRLIRTPEQIAEEEFRSALKDACDIAGCAVGSNYGKIVECVIKAGYRKQVRP